MVMQIKITVVVVYNRLLASHEKREGAVVHRLQSLMPLIRSVNSSFQSCENVVKHWSSVIYATILVPREPSFCLVNS